MSVPQSGSFVAGPGAYGPYGATPYAGFGDGYGGMGGMDMNFQLGQLNQFHQMSNLGGYGSGYIPPLGSYAADPAEDKPAAEAPKPVKRAVKKQKSLGCC